MLLNRRKIVSILMEECENIEERYEGYRKSLKTLLADIIAAERRHRVQGTSIQQHINDQCSAEGLSLMKKRSSRESN